MLSALAPNPSVITVTLSALTVMPGFWRFIPCELAPAVLMDTLFSNAVWFAFNSTLIP